MKSWDFCIWCSKQPVADTIACVFSRGSFTVLLYDKIEIGIITKKKIRHICSFWRLIRMSVCYQPSWRFRKQLTKRLSRLCSLGLLLNCNSFTFDGAQWFISPQSYIHWQWHCYMRISSENWNSHYTKKKQLTNCSSTPQKTLQVTTCNWAQE